MIAKYLKSQLFSIVKRLKNYILINYIN